MKKVLIILSFFFLLNSVSALEINSTNYALYNLNEDKLILEKDSNEKISVASLTKIMTLLVSIENIDNLNDKVIVSYNDLKGLIEEDASVAGLYVGEKVTNEDLLYALFLPSGADAANCLANNISGSVDSFVKLMNDKVKELGLKNTNFANVTGLDNKNHYSSMEDMATILKYALKNQTFKKVFETKKYTLSDNYKTLNSTFWETSYKYDYDMNFVKGAKTGYTDDAGKCLASVATDKINNIDYLLVTCGANTTFSDAYHVKDAYNIYNYYFDNYKYQTLVNKGDVLVTLKTKYSKEKEISFYSDKDITYYLSNDYDKDLISIKYDGKNTISYKNKKGEILGKANIYYKDELVSSIDIILNNEYKFSLWLFLLDTKLIYGIGLILLFVIFAFIKRGKMKNSH